MIRRCLTKNFDALVVCVCVCVCVCVLCVCVLCVCVCVCVCATTNTKKIGNAWADMKCGEVVQTS